jgi:PadR family transcriptional regulator, regulatory protein PadR
MSKSLPSISQTESLILDLLEPRERFGLELIAQSDGRLKRGSVYVTLARMEAKGFVESRQEDRAAGAIGLPRRLYTPTPYGLKVRDAYRLLRDALALKLAEVR